MGGWSYRGVETGSVVRLDAQCSSKGRRRGRSQWWRLGWLTGLLIIARVQGATNSPRIIGGSQVEHFDGGTNWVILLEQTGLRPVTCSGSIIGRRWVLTAAHCFLNDRGDGFVPDQGTSLLFGCARWCRPSETDKDCECKQARAKRVVKHPCYVPIRNEDHDDLALIETDVDLYGECESGVAVHGLNGTFDLPVGSLVNVSGFGTVSNSPQACTRANPTAVDTGLLHIPHLLCAGGEYGKDSCIGDSGGPLSVFRGGREWLVAVLSLGSEIPTWTDNCAVTGRYGVYTRTDVYANWIQSTLSGQRFGCSCSSRADPCSGGASLIVAPSDDCPTANSAPAACFGPASIVTALMLLWILLAQ